MQPTHRKVERVQTGFRLEKNLLKVLKALAAHKEIGLGDLVEGIVLHAFEGKQPFANETLDFIDIQKSAFGMKITAADSHKMTDIEQ